MTPRFNLDLTKRWGLSETLWSGVRTLIVPGYQPHPRTESDRQGLGSFQKTDYSRHEGTNARMNLTQFKSV